MPGIKSAFTLIELLTVIVVLSLLTSLAVPVFLEYRTGAANAADEAFATMIRETSNRMRLAAITQTGGDDISWPDGVLLINNIIEPEIVPAHTILPKWQWRPAQSLIFFYCPHTNLAHRRMWIYSASNGAFGEVGSGPHN